MTEQTREEMQAAGTHPAPCARMCEAQAFKTEIRSLTRENATLRTGYDAARLEIASLQAQLEAVGAGGVGRLAPDVSLISEGDMPAAPAQPVAWAMQWPDDSRLNLSTVFDTKLEATDYLKSCSDGGVFVPLYAAPQPAAQALDDAFEAVRLQLCRLERYSFVPDDDGVVRCVWDRVGNWIEFDDAHELFDPVAIDAAIAAQKGAKP